MTTIGREKGKVLTRVAAGLTAGVLALGATGCKSKDTAAPIVGPDGGDPAAANMAQPYTGGNAGGYGTAGNPAPGPGTGQVRVLGSQQAYEGQASGQDYSQAYGEASEPGAAPIIRQAPVGDPNAGQYPGGGYAQNGYVQGGYAQGGYAQGGYDGGYTDAEEAGEQAIADTDQAPPPLPEYDQPPAPDPNYLWTPGYYDYASAGYYWVPGAWVAPPFYGALWTPSWWGFYGGRYRFHRGYWGPHVGFYGGINYGFGYIGTGYYGGFWRGHDFYYNRAVTNVNVVNVHNVYNRTVVYNNHTYGPRPDNRVDFNGGRGGIQARPNSSETAALGEAHYAPVAAQRDNRLAAASNRGQFVRTDGGRPAMAFAARPIGNAADIAGVPRQQPFNHPAFPGLNGRPATAGAFNNGRGPANTTIGAAGAGRSEAPAPGTANRGFAGAPGQGNFVNRGENMNNAARPGFAENRNTPGSVTGRVPDRGAQPYEHGAPAAGVAHAPAPEVPSARSDLRPPRASEPVQRAVPPAFIERGGAAPAFRGAPTPTPRPEASPATRPEVYSAPRPEPAPAPRVAPAPAPQHAAPQVERAAPPVERGAPAAPHEAPAPHPAGGGEHEGHH